MKRKSKDKYTKQSGIDLMEPVPIDKLGTIDDPCFGKHHSITAKECNKCGDAELCSIICAQKLHLKREKIEEKTPFKDIQNVPLKRILPVKLVYRKCKKLLTKYPHGIDSSRLSKKICNKLNLTPEQFLRILNKLIKKGKLKESKNKIFINKV